MKTKILLFLITISLSTKSIHAQTPCKEIVGYYPNWQWYDRNKLVKPTTIDYSKYTIINYAFLKPTVDGHINLTDSWADENILLGEHDWQNGGYLPNTSLIDLAHNAGVKVLPSIGGWTLSNNFPAIAASQTKRDTFAQACVNLIDTYNFDGIDLDWEYPGYAPHGGSTVDKANFSLLLQAIRSAIDTYGQANGKTLILTSAVSADGVKMEFIDWTVASQNLDIINLMSYDFFGAFSANANHNAPLYKPTQGDPTFNIDSAATKLVNKYGVDPNKITIGLAFYGRSSKTAGPAALFATTTGQTDNATFSLDDGSPTYFNVLQKMNLFTMNWDSTAHVPYLTGNGSLKTFVSYDNAQSIAEKAEYIMLHHFRGAIIWEITGDYIETTLGSGVIKNTPLVDTLNYVFCNSTVSINKTQESTLNIKLYPNPTNGLIHIKLLDNEEDITLIIRNVLGQQLSSTKYNNSKSFSFLINEPKGVYFIEIRTNSDKRIIKKIIKN